MNRQSINRLFVVLSAALALNFSAAQAASLVATVNGMVCAFCAQGIEKKLRALDATQDVYVNLGQKIVVAQIKDGKRIEEAAFRELIKDAGYDIAALRTVEKTAAELKAEVKAKK